MRPETLDCHWYVKEPPDAVTKNATLLPGHTLTGFG